MPAHKKLEEDRRPEGADNSLASPQLVVFLKLAAWASILGGGLRMVMALVPWQANSLTHELPALLIDLCVVTALIAYYLMSSPRLGVLGTLGVGLASLGMISIVGPDATAFELDMYALGASLAGLGLGLLGLAGLINRFTPSWTYWVFILVPLCSVGLSMVGFAELGFGVAGVLFGLGFIGIGRELLSWTRSEWPKTS